MNLTVLGDPLIFGRCSPGEAPAHPNLFGKRLDGKDGTMMSRSNDHEKWGLVFLFALTLECWIEGLVVDAGFGVWVFHAIAAIACGLALYRSSRSAVIAAGGLSLVAFVSDLEAVTSNGLPLRFVLPSLLLVVGAGVLFYGLVQIPQRRTSPSASQSQSRFRTRAVAEKVFDTAAASAGVPTLRKNLIDSKDDPAWTPFLLISGVLVTLYSMVYAKWIRVDAFFGLTSRSLAFNDLRDVYDSIGVKYFARSFYFEWGFMLLYLSAVFGGIVLVGWFTKRFSVAIPLLYLVISYHLITLFIHTAVILGLTHAAEEPQILVGSWLGSLGIAAILAGTWLSSEYRP